MKHLIIFAHPNTDSLNATLKQTLVDHLKAQQHDVVVRDLYQLNFNPVPSLQDMQGQRAGQVASEVKREQEFITWAECITFIYPIWWTGLPAIMKGYVDRVFSYGFAYRYDQGVQQGLLVGKQAVVINTHGKSAAEYEASGMDKALSLTSDTGIYEYCGLRVKQHLYFDQADSTGLQSFKIWQVQVKEVYAS